MASRCTGNILGRCLVTGGRCACLCCLLNPRVYLDRNPTFIKDSEIRELPFMCEFLLHRSKCGGRGGGSRIEVNKGYEQEIILLLTERQYY